MRSVRWIPSKPFPRAAGVYPQEARVVLCHGTFDLIHPGHLEHLRQARALGDWLVVTITADAYVSKGPGRPAFDEAQRAVFLSHLDLVDAVGIVDGPSALPAIEEVKPAVYCKGPDYQDHHGGKLAEERAAVERYGGKVVFTDGFTHSSTQLLNAHLPIVSNGIAAFIAAFKQHHSLADVAAVLAAARKLRMTTIGEQILDDYIFVQPAGKSAKENLVVFESIGGETYHGGIEVINANLEQFVAAVTYHRSDCPPVVKRRYVDRAFNQKLFEVCERPSSSPHKSWPRKFPGALVLVADFGHGVIPDSECAEAIAKAAPWLALMVQSNGLNWGFNLISKWPRADYWVVDEPELRLAVGSKDGDLKALLAVQHHRLGVKMSAVTLGHRGCMIYDGHEYVECPALADKVIDRMGAGDAFLAATAPLAFVDASPWIIALVGSVAAALKVRTVGNVPIKREDVERWLKSLLA